MAPTSRPRVGAAATRTTGSPENSRPSTTFCRLPPESCARRGLRPRGLDLVAGDEGLGQLADASQAKERPDRGRGAAVGLQHHVRGDGQAGRHAGGQAVLGDVGQPAGDGAARVTGAQGPPADPDLAGPGRSPAMASASSRWPLPATPATPTISPARTSEGHVVQRRRAAVALGAHARDLEDHLAGAVAAGLAPGVLDLAPHHQGGQRRRRSSRPCPAWPRSGPGAARSRGRPRPSPRGACAR